MAASESPTITDAKRPADARRSLVVYLSFFLSGVAGLGYEIVWTRLFSTGLGHEYISVLAVVGAFFGGIAVGALALDGVISRSRRPGVWYACLEATVAAWALVTLWLIPSLNDQVASLTGTTPSPVRHWLVAFGVPFLALLPATSALGATLPAIDRLCCRLEQQGRSVGALYAINTLGAVVGVLVTTYVLVPRFGYPSSTFILVATSLTCTALILTGPARWEVDRQDVVADAGSVISGIRLDVTLLVTGFLGIAYEVLCVRVMSQALQNTVYSFSSLLAVYLVGTAAGAAVYQRMGHRFEFGRMLNFLLYGLALSCGLGIVLLRFSRDVYDAFRAGWGGGFAGSIAGEMFLAAIVFALPTLLMGATFSHLALAARHRQGGVGRALGLNTFGSTLAPILVGVFLYGAVGAKWTMVAAAASYLFLLPTIRLGVLIPVVAAISVLFVFPADLVLVPLNPGQKLITVKEGLFGNVAVVQEPQQRVLMLNGHFQMGGTGPGELSERRQAHLPLLLHPDPKDVLFLGLGSGITFAAVADHPGVRGQGVELIPEVVEVLPEFGDPVLPALQTPRLDIIVADARRFVSATDRQYDVIVGDLFHPARDGAGSLYTVEHFRAIKAKLKADGLFCQWLPLHQIEDPVLRVIIRSYLEVFPSTRAYWAYFNINTPMLGLVGAQGSPVYTGDWLEHRRQQHPVLRQATDETGFQNTIDLLGSLVATPEMLRDYVGDSRLNTDLHPVVLFEAPDLAYNQLIAGVANSMNFLQRFRPDAAELVDPAAQDSDNLARRLNAYIRARDLYLQGNYEFIQNQHGRGRELLLQSVQTSADFRPSYDLLITMAQQGAASNPVQVRQFLMMLESAAPDRTEAGQLRRFLFPDPAGGPADRNNVDRAQGNRSNGR